jgi:hypothetical protein
MSDFKSGKMAVNQTIAGFSSTIEGEVSLTPIKADRNVCLIRYTDSGAVELIEVKEPFHDSNKLYASLRSYPTHLKINVPEIEDLGVENVLEKHACAELPAVEEYKAQLPPMIGGAWILSTSKPEVPSSTKIALCFKEGAQWSVVAVTVNELISESTGNWSPQKVQTSLETLNIPRGSTIIPIMRPLRIETAAGVVFVG